MKDFTGRTIKQWAGLGWRDATVTVAGTRPGWTGMARRYGHSGWSETRAGLGWRDAAVTVAGLKPGLDWDGETLYGHSGWSQARAGLGWRDAAVTVVGPKPGLDWDGETLRSQWLVPSPGWTRMARRCGHSGWSQARAGLGWRDAAVTVAGPKPGLDWDGETLRSQWLVPSPGWTGMARRCGHSGWSQARAGLGWRDATVTVVGPKPGLDWDGETLRSQWLVPSPGWTGMARRYGHSGWSQARSVPRSPQ